MRIVVAERRCAVRKWVMLASATAGAAVFVAVLAGNDDIRRFWLMHNMCEQSIRNGRTKGCGHVFTGWIDVGLSENGEKQAQQAGAFPRCPRARRELSLGAGKKARLHRILY